MTPRNKVVIVGATHTGKTSIVQRFINDQFSLNTITTNQAAFFKKEVVVENTNVVLEIWDTAGQERFHSLAPMYYRDAQIAIVVFDITDASSFSKSKQWISELKSERSDGISLYLVGNKLDLSPFRVVTTTEATQYSKLSSIEYLETSAKLGSNIELLYTSVARDCIKRQMGIQQEAPMPIDHPGVTTFCC